MNVLASDAPHATAAVASNPMADTTVSREFLGIEVQQIAQMRRLIPAHRHRRLERPQPSLPTAPATKWNLGPAVGAPPRAGPFSVPDRTRSRANKPPEKIGF